MAYVIEQQDEIMLRGGLGLVGKQETRTRNAPIPNEAAALHVPGTLLEIICPVHHEL
ncbi:hypothetical protein [Bradyrhizobium genosp. P]|uniref:hypothetical protein n=1 Tax=Bradyrhizobium genosp. P TaxID=83641 RepID=UPI003CF4E0FA